MDDVDGGNSLRHLVMKLSPYITENGFAIINNVEVFADPNTFTKKLIELKKKID
jgi:hypothetical protein|tara:strand:+ start:759 stop:920 length:162 start_codon:yes stop_codon:yes gene_type:complete